jgi:hypothetical protein
MRPRITVRRTNDGVEAILLDGKTEVGHFIIQFGTTYSLNIGIEQEYQGQGYSIQLMNAVCRDIDIPHDKKLYIDTDASEGFWNYLGLVPNPMYDFTEEQRNMEGAGYEKYIVFSDLLNKLNS